MGCFLGCFGFSKKKRRRKSGSKYASGAHSYGRYVPLDSDVSVKLDSDEMQEASANKLRDKPKESTTTKIKKKVSFNLNVKTYEPLPNYEETSSCFSEGEKERIWGYNEEETAGASMKYLNYEDNLMSSKLGSFPANHRYQNCRDTYDEEDEIEFEDIDLEDDVDDDLDFDEEDFVESHDSEYDCPKMSNVVKADERVTTAHLARESCGNLMKLQANQDLNKTESNQNARKRSQYVFSVLGPVENLTQWKEVKANSRQQLKLQKENIMLEQEKKPPLCMKKSDPLPLNPSLIPNRLTPSHEIAVDASLSNWIVSSRNVSNTMEKTAKTEKNAGETNR